MKNLAKLALAALMLATATAGQAQIVSGHFRSNGTYVAPYYRTPANGTPYDNLSYRGYPSQQPGYVSPSNGSLSSEYGRPKPMPSYQGSRYESGLLPNTGSYTQKPLYGNSRSFGSEN